MPGYIEDRWYKKDANGKRTIPTDRVDQGKRYKVAGVPGVRDRSFEKLLGPQGAKAWLAKAQHESTRGEFIDPRDGNILLREYVEKHWWPNQSYPDPVTRATIRGKVWNHILTHLGPKPLNTVKTPQLRAWMKTLNAQLGAGTVNDVWGALSAILQAAVDDERITKNYCRSQKSVRPPPGRSPVRKRGRGTGSSLSARRSTSGFGWPSTLGSAQACGKVKSSGSPSRTSTSTPKSSMCRGR